MLLIRGWHSPRFCAQVSVPGHDGEVDEDEDDDDDMVGVWQRTFSDVPTTAMAFLPSLKPVVASLPKPMASDVLPRNILYGSKSVGELAFVSKSSGGMPPGLPSGSKPCASSLTGGGNSHGRFDVGHESPNSMTSLPLC